MHYNGVNVAPPASRSLVIGFQAVVTYHGLVTAMFTAANFFLCFTDFTSYFFPKP